MRRAGLRLDWRHLYARPVWRMSDLDRAMRAAELIAGPDWRDDPRGEDEFVRVLADSVHWLPWWRATDESLCPAWLRWVLCVLGLAVLGLLIALASGADVTPDALFGKWEPTAGVLALALLVARRVLLHR